MKVAQRMSRSRVYLLGGYQTDFAVNWSQQGKTIFDILEATVTGALTNTCIKPHEVEVAHLGNFAGELFCRQGHLGGLFASIHPDLAGIPAFRHEAACASGSVAILSAAAEIEAGRYQLACVAGIEQMRNVTGQEAADFLGVAAWTGKEGQEAQYPWPYFFSRIAEEYDRRYGLKYEHLARIAQINYDNAKRNPKAQTRDWKVPPEWFSEDDQWNPVVEGRTRKQDCARITDGGAAVFLASETFAKAYVARCGLKLESLPFIKGWGHRTAPIGLDAKIQASRNHMFVFPHLRQTIEDAFCRAEIESVQQLDGIETHDCFSISEYLAIDHFGITQPGENWRAIENGEIEWQGRIPINPSGGLIGAGHPVGATGVRMALDAFNQVSGRAGNYQIEGAKTFATLNLGGSVTTTVCLIIRI